jgi:hypothetical protein
VAPAFVTNVFFLHSTQSICHSIDQSFFQLRGACIARA